MPEPGDELLEVRLKKRQELQAKGLNPYPAHFHRTHSNAEAVRLFQQAEAAHSQDARTEPVTVAGRILAIRRMGKAAFLKLVDGSGNLQLHLRKDALGAEFDLLDLLDLGDHLGVTGPVFRTRMGEVTVEAQSLMVLSKAIRQPPEKWHGLKDTEQRFRQRELDLMSSEEVRERFLMRGRVVSAIRRLMDGRGFLEVDTPILVPVPAGAMARPFITHHNALDRDLFLRIATELYLKRCVIGGLDRVYEIGRVFRNEGVDFKHNPEFTTMESYEAYADYRDVMRMVEELVSTGARAANGSMKVVFEGQELDFTPPWPRLDLHDEIKRRTGIDIDEYTQPEALAAQMREAGIDPGGRASYGLLVDKIVSEKLEPSLMQPAFLVDYPKEMSPLAKEKPDRPGYVERFEAFAGGMEIANAFTELNDPVEQRKRFLEQEELRKLYGEEDFDRLDEAFLSAIEHGMPPTGGLGVGIDRLVMLFAGQRSIREVVLFPQLRT
jgi:lysyl-tRNA synthetase class 2